MTGAMDPRKVFQHLRDTYLRYLETSFLFKDPDLQRQFRGILRDKSQPPLVRQPILEVSPRYKKGDTIEGLVRKGVVSDGFLQLDHGALPPQLYAHQERGLKRAIEKHRNLVVATGTGSGKTEVFLFPIFDYLFRERASGSISEPGARALLLYPMNALANDQIERLRGLLGEMPEVTFGRYTGETKYGFEEAHDLFVSRHGQEPLSNELICRDQMRETPPHILLTNYAMLEYLLIRPDDSPLFAGGRWRFIVLDEVHTYSGAMGIEIAMLLRRLKNRVADGRAGMLQCFATSATLGSGPRDKPKIAKFATDLFGEDFNENDVIEAEYELQSNMPEWGRGTSEGYRALREVLATTREPNPTELIEAAKEHFPSSLVDEVDPGHGDDDERCRLLLGGLLQGDGNVNALKSKLTNRQAVLLSELAEEEAAIDLVALSTYARVHDGRYQLLPAGACQRL